MCERRRVNLAARRWPMWEATVVAVLGVLVGVQLFVPPIVGMADNGDFVKIAARLCLQLPATLVHNPDRYWHYFISSYEVAPQHCLVTWPWSSMVPIVWVAKHLHRLVGIEAHFDIRVLGAVCAAMWMACAWGMLRLLTGAPAAVKITAGVTCLAVPPMYSMSRTFSPSMPTAPP
jgi:hypothetical protein